MFGGKEIMTLSPTQIDSIHRAQPQQSISIFNPNAPSANANSASSACGFMDLACSHPSPPHPLRRHHSLNYPLPQIPFNIPMYFFVSLGHIHFRSVHNVLHICMCRVMPSHKILAHILIRILAICWLIEILVS
jgi:hypothetical protein